VRWARAGAGSPPWASPQRGVEADKTTAQLK